MTLSDERYRSECYRGSRKQFYQHRFGDCADPEYGGFYEEKVSALKERGIRFECKLTRNRR